MGEKQMKISTKGRYALRLMMDIALHQEEGSPVRIKEIASRLGVSETTVYKHLRRALNQLRTQLKKQ